MSGVPALHPPHKAAELREDGYLDVMASASAANAAAARGAGIMSLVGLDEALATDGLAALIVERPADDAVSSGFVVEKDKKGFIQAECDRLNLPAVAFDALRMARARGAAAVLTLTDDGPDLSAPLNLSRLGAVTGLVAYSADRLRAGSLAYGDPSRPDYGHPTSYTINPERGADFEVHETRLLRVPGDPLPPGGWASGPTSAVAWATRLPWAGRSALAVCWADLQRYRAALGLIRAMMERKQQAVHKMQGLGQMLIAGQDAVVQKRLAIADAVRSLFTAVSVDSGDDFLVTDTSLSGVGEAMRELKLALSASSGMPLAVLFGEDANGLNASSEGALSTYHDRVRGFRERSYRPMLEPLISLLYAQRGTPREPKAWKIVFNPLWSPTEKEVAEAAQARASARKTEVESLASLIAMKVLTPEQGTAYARTAWPDYGATEAAAA